MYTMWIVSSIQHCANHRKESTRPHRRIEMDQSCRKIAVLKYQLRTNIYSIDDKTYRRRSLELLGHAPVSKTIETLHRTGSTYLNTCETSIEFISIRESLK